MCASRVYDRCVKLDGEKNFARNKHRVKGEEKEEEEEENRRVARCAGGCNRKGYNIEWAMRGELCDGTCYEFIRSRHYYLFYNYYSYCCFDLNPSYVRLFAFDHYYYYYLRFLQGSVWLATTMKSCLQNSILLIKLQIERSNFTLLW